MAVTVREVLDDALVATAEPQVEVAGDSLDNPVRWVFTNEREDVASFWQEASFWWWRGDL